MLFTTVTYLVVGHLICKASAERHCTNSYLNDEAAGDAPISSFRSNIDYKLFGLSCFYDNVDKT